MAAEFLWEHHSPEKLLVERFHITTGFHPGQRTIIEHLVQGQRILAIQHTGWGKSLCYQMASLYYPHLVIVFSPLKALMRDQCQRCNNVYAIPSAIVSSEFSEEENRLTLERAWGGQLKLLFIAPERLSNNLWQSYVPKMSISMIVIDEAHCISTWGHDFRPHYRRIVHLLNAIPKNTPVLALTATANKRVEQDILQQMGEEVHVVRGTMKRPNLYLNVVPVSGDQQKLSYLATILPHVPGVGIIYTATKRDAELVASFLLQQGIVAEYYHADRDEDVRRDIEHKLMTNQFKVVCSTNALGMGIDKHDIRFIVHYHLPASPIHYYQEMGRSGRDSNIAWCVLLYDPNDLAIQQHFISNAKPESKCYETMLKLLRIQDMTQSEIMLKTGYAQTVVRTILIDLEDQHFIERNAKRAYMALLRLGQVDFSSYDYVRQQKLEELSDIQNYTQCRACYMEYLTTYLGDEPGGHCGTCGQCLTTNFPSIQPPERIQRAVAHFLEEGQLPSIEKRGTVKTPVHEAGWALSFHGTSRIGKLVRASKYEHAGPLPDELVIRAAQVIQTRYPLNAIHAIVSVPPTISGILLEDFARRVAALLGKTYLPVLGKIRPTTEQKFCTNYLQKRENVKQAFVVRNPELINGQTLLLIDDIYDSGQMLSEIGRTLMRAGAYAIYPFTITRTRHSDDQ